QAVRRRLAADQAQAVPIDRLRVRFAGHQRHRMAGGELRGVDAADCAAAEHDNVLDRRRSGHDAAHAFRCRKNSWLPVAPRIADGCIATRDSPQAAAASVTRATTASWTAGSETIPCAPTSSRPA